MSRAAAPNLFAKAKTAASGTDSKKKKGTVLELPTKTDAEGNILPEFAELHAAITDAIAANQEADAAKKRCDLCKSKLAGYALDQVVDLFALNGVMPTSPVSLVNKGGESVTYVIQDKSQQNGLDAEQVAMLHMLLGDALADSIITTRDVYSFNPAVMAQQAGGEKNKAGETVGDVVFDLVSRVLQATNRLSDEQKGELIKTVSKTTVKENTLQRAAEYCGANAKKLKQFFQACGSSFVKYVLT